MAIAPTPNNSIYKGLVFDDIDSRDYGIYITGSAVFNSPERDVDMIEIPGRNGTYALDKGRFNNIEVTYPAGLFGGSEADFAAGIRAFRNALASRIGYKRLEDDYNPNEYRMAVYSSGLDVTPAQLKAGEFDIKFNCKPQRFLKSGEIPRTIGGSVTNTQTESGSIVSIESDGGDAVTSLAAQIDPVQTGSGDPSPSNVRPITGRTQTKVFDTGKNLVDESTAIGSNASVTVDGGYISVTKSERSNYPAAHINAYLRAGVTYTISATCVQATAQAKLAIRDIAPSKTTVASTDGYFTDGQRKSVTYTPTKSGMYRVALFSSFGAADTGTAIFTDVQCEIGSTATAYEPYTGATTTTALGRTVYGGTLNVVTGVLTVTHQMDTYTGDSVTSVSSASGVQFARIVASNASPGTQVKCDRYTPSSVAASGHITWVSATQQVVRIFDSRFTDAATAKSILNENPVHYCYPLTTPQTYALTAQQVELLTGQNHVWADTGDITITWGDDPNKLVNPTLYDSHPLLHVWGYGDIGIGGDTLSINNDEYGRTLLANRLSKSATSVSSYLDESAVLMLNSGDDVFVSAGSSVVFPLTFLGSASINIISATIANSSPYDFPMESSVSNFGNYVTVSVSLPQLDFIFNQTLQHLRSNIRVTINYTEAGVSKTSTAECQIHAQYSLTPLGRYRVALFYYDVAVDKFRNQNTAVMTIQPIYGVSTQRPFSDDADFYFDLDIGEAYKIEDGQIISVNNAVTIPAQLPTLKSGANTITYDDTITQFKVVPRWWEV